MSFEEGAAFTAAYLSAIEANFEMDLRTIESMLIAVGHEQMTDEQKRKARRSMEDRREISIGCPMYSLAVWDHEEVG